jgi:methylated-DNA-protein-cysteine methyltransferase-like protein
MTNRMRIARSPGGQGGSYERIYAVVRRIPRGRVATYGQIAGLAGLPRQARLVGYALAALPDDVAVPWHRVVNALGAVSPRRRPGYGLAQRALLEAEGIVFEGGRLSLARYRWRARGVTGGEAGRAGDLETIPGVGPSIARDLLDLGMRRVADLRGASPERLYTRLCERRGTHQDRCLLYVFRCAVYYAETPDADPNLLKWWKWKDRGRPTAGTV